jgi:hypothetical protein
MACLEKKSHPKVTEEVLQAWIEEADSWGHGKSPQEVSSVMQRVEALRALLEDLRTTLKSFKSPTEVVSVLPSTGKLISRLLPNICIQSSSPACRLLVECLQAFSSFTGGEPETAFDRRASKWAAELIRSTAIVRFPDDKVTAAVCRISGLTRKRVASAKAEDYSQTIKKRLQALPNREWSKESLAFLPVTSFSGKAHRNVAVKLLPIAGDCNVQDTVKEVASCSAVCDIFNPTEVKDQMTDSMFVDIVPVEPSISSDLLVSLVTNCADPDVKVLQWISDRNVYEEEFLSFVEKLLDIDELTGNFFENCERLIKSLHMPDAWVLHPDLFFYSDTILHQLVNNTGLHPKLLSVISCFTKCFVDCIKKSHLQPSLCLGHFYPPHMRALVVLLSTEPSSIDDICTYVNRIGQALMDDIGLSPSGHLCKHLQWLILLFGWWKHIAIDTIIVDHGDNCWNAATLIMSICLDPKRLIDIPKLRELVALIMRSIHLKGENDLIQSIAMLPESEKVLCQQLLFHLLASSQLWRMKKDRNDLTLLLRASWTLFNADPVSLLSMTSLSIRAQLTQPFYSSVNFKKYRSMQDTAHTNLSLVCYVEMLQEWVMNKLHGSNTVDESKIAILMAEVAKAATAASSHHSTTESL